jgi:hypothetical protein
MCNKGTVFVKILFRRELLTDFSNILVFANFKQKNVLTKIFAQICYLPKFSLKFLFNNSKWARQLEKIWIRLLGKIGKDISASVLQTNQPKTKSEDSKHKDDLFSTPLWYSLFFTISHLGWPKGSPPPPPPELRKPPLAPLSPPPSKPCLFCQTLPTRRLSR